MATLFYGNTHNTDIRHLLRPLAVSDDIALLIVEGDVYAYFDSREYELAREKLKYPVFVEKAEPFLKSKANATNRTGGYLEALIKSHNLTEVVVSTNFPLALGDFLRTRGFTVTTEETLINRRNKTSADVECIKSALSQTESVLENIIERELKEASIAPDKSLIRNSGENLTRELLSKLTFKALIEAGLYSKEGMIISCGQQASIPHHPGSGPLMANETIVVDLFPQDISTGYFADITRTYIKGVASEQHVNLYQTVKQAQVIATKLIMPGQKYNKIHQAVLDHFKSSGFATSDSEGFTHATGHGLGLDIHEAPTVANRSNEVVEVGDVITIEPGLYYKNIGGVRLEDVLYVKADGVVNLTNHPKNFQID